MFGRPSISDREVPDAVPFFAAGMGGGRRRLPDWHEVGWGPMLGGLAIGLLA